MTTRRARLVFEPLLDWPHPQVRHEQSQFSARWPQTRDLLLAGMLSWQANARAIALTMEGAGMLS